MGLARLFKDNFEDLAAFLNIHDLSIGLICTNTIVKNSLIHSNKIITRKINIQKRIIDTCVYHYNKRILVQFLTHKPQIILKNTREYLTLLNDIYDVLGTHLTQRIKPAQNRIRTLMNE